MRILWTFLILLGGAITLTIGRTIAASEGISLGAIPTVLLVLPWLYLARRVWRRRPQKLSREEMVTGLRQMIDDPNTPDDKRAWARDRLGKLDPSDT